MDDRQSGPRRPRRMLALTASTALAAACLAGAAPPQPAAATDLCPAGANLVVKPKDVQAIDPSTSSTLTVPASVLPRHFDEIVAASFYSNITVTTTRPDGRSVTASYIKVCIQTNGPQPSWPDVASGDLGTEFEACGDATEGPGFVGQDVVQTGTATNGAPVFDGPYNPEEGWKACGVVVFGAGEVGSGPLDAGFAWRYDPADPGTGASAPTFLDAANDLVLPPASWIASEVVVFYVPQTVMWSTTPTSSTAVDVSEVVFDGGHSNNLVAESLSVTPSSSGTTGRIVHWAPGGELGSPAYHYAGVDIGTNDNSPAGGNASPTCPDSDSPGSDDPVQCRSTRLRWATRPSAPAGATS